MVFKKLFRSERDAPADEASTIEDLIVLERYDEAVNRLKARLRQDPDDLHAHLRLAEAYVGLKEHSRAVDEYVYVAEEYAQDGFYDRGLALLMKAKRHAPLDQDLDEKIERFRLAKDSERTRTMVIEGLRGRSGGATAAVLVERLWHKVAPSPLVRELRPEVLKRLFSVMELVSWKADERVASQGDGGEGARLYFLVDGVVRARIPGDEGPAAVIRDFGPGDVIGETVLLERRSWPADYQAAEPSRALALGRDGLEKALVGNPDPRGFLTALRMQHHDRDVTKNLARITGA